MLQVERFYRQSRTYRIVFYAPIIVRQAPDDVNLVSQRLPSVHVHATVLATEAPSCRWSSCVERFAVVLAIRNSFSDYRQLLFGS